MMATSEAIPARAWLIALTVLGLPAVAFAALRLVPSLDIALGTMAIHFYIVTAVAVLALTLAIAVVIAARRLPEARTFFLAAGFLVMALVFFAHGAATSPWLATGHENHEAYADGYASTEVGEPDDYADTYAEQDKSDEYSYGGYSNGSSYEGAEAYGSGITTQTARSRLVGFSALLSLAASAPFFALAVVELRQRWAAFIAQNWNRLFLALLAPCLGYILVALFLPTWLAWLPTESTALEYGVALGAISCLGFAVWRFLQAYRLGLLPLQGTMALSMALLIEAQVFLVFGSVGQLSWWEYHAVMLAGFLATVLALLSQFRATGDLGVVVEGLFLREQIRGLQHDDPRALPALVAAVSAKDNETAGHTERVSALAVEIGRELGLTEASLIHLRWAGRLHDVGKIGVPNSVMRKPGRLTPSEYEVVRRHSHRGWWIASRSRALAQIAPIVRAHHEHVDGSGYPDGLRGDQIPVEARVVAVADFWDALTGDRPYRAALSYEEAAAITRDATGSHLDPDCVGALFSVLTARPIDLAA